MGSSVSRPTGRTSFSVISAKASAALRWRSTLSEKESVVSAESGEPVKKLVVVRSFETSRARDQDAICVLEGSTYFRGIEEGQPLPPAHSLIAGVHTIESCGNGLRGSGMPRDRCEGVSRVNIRVYAQQDSQQEERFPISKEEKRVYTRALRELN